MSIANELITRGWTQQNEEEADGRVCLRGAASYAYFGDVEHAYCLSDEVKDALQRATHQKDYGIATWQDRTERTFDDVLRAAKEADELLEAAALREDVSDPEEQIER